MEENMKIENAETEQVVKKAKKKKGKGKGKKKNRKRGLPVGIAVVIVVLALLFGTVLGYAYGRNYSSARVRELEGDLDALRTELMIATGVTYDEFTDEPTEENLEALDDLAGGEEISESDGTVSALMGEDEFEYLPEEEADDEPEEDFAVAEYKGGTLMRSEVSEAFNEQLAMELFNGISADEFDEESVRVLMEEMIRERVLKSHAEELGVAELTEEDGVKIDAEAVENFAAQVEYAAETATPAGGETKEEAATRELAEEGVTYLTVRAEIEEGWWEQKLFDKVTEDVTVDDGTLEAVWRDLAQTQETAYRNYPEDYEFSQMTGEIICWNPEGCRAVQMLCIGFGDYDTLERAGELSEQIAAAETGSEQLSALTSELDACYASAEEKAAAALESYRNGTSFEELLDTFGEDDGMAGAYLRSTGYYISENSVYWPQEVVIAAMKLTESEDVSPVIRTADGVCVLKLLGDVKSGEVPFENVKEALREQETYSAAAAAYEEKVSAWMEEADAKYYPERMM